MKCRHNTLTGIAAFALVFITILFAGCFTLGGSGGSSGNTGDSPKAAPVQYVPEGTYTFYPRPRGMKNGLDVDAYLDKIIVHSNIMNLYFVNRPVAPGRGGLGSGNFNHSKILQDLDNPSRSYNATSWKEESGAYVVTFENVTGKRFSFTNEAYGTIELVFEEIVLDEPDRDLQLPALRNGTYTYYPRPRGMKNGQDVNAYLDKIIIRSGYMNLYFVNTSDGNGRGGLGSGNFNHSKVLQNLDYPQLAYEASAWREESGAYIVTFQDVTATRFSFTNEAYGTIELVFDEIILGEPDA